MSVLLAERVRHTWVPEPCLDHNSWVERRLLPAAAWKDGCRPWRRCHIGHRVSSSLQCRGMVGGHGRPEAVFRQHLWLRIFCVITMMLARCTSAWTI